MSLTDDEEGQAAEYALGTLDDSERIAVSARRLREPDLDASITSWEGRFGPLIEATPSRTPPEGLFARILLRLGQQAPVNLTTILQARVARWRAVAGGAGALAAGLAAALVLTVVTRPTSPHQFVAVLQKSPDAPAFAMTVDIDKQEFTVRPVAAESPANRSYQLWVISPNQNPKSLGLIDARAVSGERKIEGDKTALRDSIYAVTVEPLGGSPTGQPTSAPILFGKLVPVGP